MYVAIKVTKILMKSSAAMIAIIDIKLKKQLFTISSFPWSINETM